MNAITGVLAADFSRFVDAVAGADASLQAFEGGAGKVESALNRMVDQFSGRRVIQEATIMGEAIERAGGVVNLTGAELQRAGAKAEEAAEKMRALGIKVPEGIQAIATAAQGASSETTVLGQTFTAVFGAMAADKVVSAVAGQLKQMAVDAFRAADALVVLEAQTGIGVEALGRMRFGAEQAGTTLDAVAGASLKLSLAIAKGGAGTAAAIDELGLSFETVKRLSPEQQFFAVTRALGEIEKSSDQVRLANEIVGKSYRELLGVANQGFADLAAAAPESSETATRALEGLGDTYEAFWAQNAANVTNYGGLFATFVTGQWGKAFDIAKEMSGLGAGGFPLPVPPPALVVGVTDLTLGLAEQNRAIGELTASAEAQMAAAEKLAAAEAKAAEQAQVWGDQDIQLLLRMAELDAGARALEAGGLNVMDLMLQSLDYSTTDLVETLPDVAAGVAAVGASAEASAAALGAMTGGLHDMSSFTNPYALSGQMSKAEQSARAKELGGVINFDSYGNPYVYVPGKNSAGSLTPNPRGGWGTPGEWGPRPMAAGGAVAAGSAYWVGERGPELFLPSSAGSIVPAGGAGAVTINVSTVMGNAADIARVVSAALVDAARASGTRLAIGV